MPDYCVNSNAQANGDHEVHETSPNTCGYLPSPVNQIDLGWHSDCHGAVKEAKRRGYNTANGCYYCCKPCHTGQHSVCDLNLTKGRQYEKGDTSYILITGISGIGIGQCCPGRCLCRGVLLIWTMIMMGCLMIMIPTSMEEVTGIKCLKEEKKSYVQP